MFPNPGFQVVDFAPVHQMFHLVPVGQFIVILDEAHTSCVVRILQEVVGAESGTTVVGHQGEQQRAENTALGGTGVRGPSDPVCTPDSGG